MVLLSKKLWMSSRDYVIIVLALCLFGFGFSAFILPEKVVMGGVTGIGDVYKRQPLYARPAETPHGA